MGFAYVLLDEANCNSALTTARGVRSGVWAEMTGNDGFVDSFGCSELILTRQSAQKDDEGRTDMSTQRYSQDTVCGDHVGWLELNKVFWQHEAAASSRSMMLEKKYGISNDSLEPSGESNILHRIGESDRPFYSHEIALR